MKNLLSKIALTGLILAIGIQSTPATAFWKNLFTPIEKSGFRGAIIGTSLMSGCGLKMIADKKKFFPSQQVNEDLSVIATQGGVLGFFTGAAVKKAEPALSSATSFVKRLFLATPNKIKFPMIAGTSLFASHKAYQASGSNPS